MGLFTPNIKKLDRENNIDELIKYLDSKRSSLRCRAFVALSGKKDLSEKNLMKLREMLHDPNPWVKTIATLKFLGKGDKSISNNLLEIMEKGSPDDKLDLLTVISSRSTAEDETILQVIMVGLIDRKEKVRIKAIEVAGLLKNRHLVPHIGDMLNARHHKERLLAAKALFDIGGDESIDYLVGLLADNHPEVIAAARLYLETVDNEYVQKALHEASFMTLIKNMNDKEPVRAKAAREIGTDGIREGLPLLHRATKDKYKGVRIEALRSISMFGSQSSVDIVAKLLSDKFYDVRLEALNTLEKLSGPRAKKAVKTALSDKNRNVRNRAEEILGLQN